LTHINYAFMKIVDGKVAPLEENLFQKNTEKIKYLKNEYKDVKILISIGGWTDSGEFSDIAFSHKNRLIFANSALEIIREFNLDGIDISSKWGITY